MANGLVRTRPGTATAAPGRDRRRPGGGQRGALRAVALAAGRRAAHRAAPAPAGPLGRPVVGAELGLGRETLVAGSLGRWCRGARRRCVCRGAGGSGEPSPVPRRPAPGGACTRCPSRPARGAARSRRPRGGGLPWGAVGAARGGARAAWASAVSSVLFGAWHVLPAVDGVRATSDRDEPMARGALIRQVAATVVFTTVAGLVFALLRQRSEACSRPSSCTGRPTGWASSRPPGREGPPGLRGKPLSPPGTAPTARSPAGAPRR